MLGRNEDNRDQGSYRELSETLMAVSGKPTEDARNLWKRMVFNALTGNVDDHLRNHGFLRSEKGWVLSPAYDLNPNPEKKTHALSFDGVSSTPSLNLCLSLFPYPLWKRDRGQEGVGAYLRRRITMEGDCKRYRTGAERDLQNGESFFAA